MEKQNYLGPDFRHDLKNQLAGILAAMDLFLDNLLGPITDEQRKHLSNVKIAAQKILKQINSLPVDEAPHV